jgi:hypothetical protein
MAGHNHTPKDRAWVVAVTMGYGHLRAAYPLKELGGAHYLFADDYPGIPSSDLKIWRNSRKFYETVSRFRNVPIVGTTAFKLLDDWQSIPAFYPRRDLSKAIFQVREAYHLFKRGFMKHLVAKFSREKLPLVTSFFLVAQAAEYHGFKKEIYCIVCDTDVSRIWAPLNPKTSKIKYLAPNRRVVERLKQYGVSPKRIYLTGFPMPKPLVGGTENQRVRVDIGARLANLDPTGIYERRFGPAVQKLLGARAYPSKKTHTLTLAFAVGGAGAQREMAEPILKSLKPRIKSGEIRVMLIAGNRQEVADYFTGVVRKLGMGGWKKGVSVLVGKDKQEYFKKFEHALHEIDILWTKPSELSFYVALGIPIILAPTIGSQEDFNSWWLRNIGAGIPPLDIRYTNEWLFDWLDSGWLARAAMEGFTNAPGRGVYRIEELVVHGKPLLPEPIEPV